MRKLLTFLIALSAVAVVNLSAPAPSQAWWQSIQQVAVSAGSAYSGPGDVKTSWKVWWGTRAFSNATLGTKLVNICNSTGGVDVLCADASSNASTGVLVIPGSLSTFCPGSVCTIKTYYDQSGASACSGPCDQTQTTVASRMILTANALGASTGTCGVASGAQIYIQGSFTSLAQPFTVSAVVQFTTTSGSILYFGGSAGIGFGEQSSVFRFYANSTVNGSASNTSPVALQNIAGGSGATASFVVNNATVGTAGSSGNLATGTGLYLAVDPFSEFMNGPICEVGLYPAAFNTTDASNMYANQHTFWGF
jgi:hypothetical protein